MHPHRQFPRSFLSPLLLVLACGPIDPEPQTPPSNTPPPISLPESPPKAPIPQPEPGPLTLRTWNLENFPQNNQTLYEVATIIEDRPAQMIALQEIREPETFWALADDLPVHEGILAESGYYTGVGILYDRNALTLLSSRSLFVDDSYAFPRPPLFATFEIADSSERLHVIVVHLKAQLDRESEARRRAAIQRLHAWISDRGLEDEALVVLGDFNDKLTDSPQYNVFAPMLEDSDFRFLTMPLALAGDYSYISFEAMIDHVLVTSATLERLDEDSTEVLQLHTSWTDYEDLVSDHLPVDTTLLIPAPQQ